MWIKAQLTLIEDTQTLCLHYNMKLYLTHKQLQKLKYILIPNIPTLFHIGGIPYMTVGMVGTNPIYTIPDWLLPIVSNPQNYVFSKYSYFVIPPKSSDAQKISPEIVNNKFPIYIDKCLLESPHSPSLRLYKYGVVIGFLNIHDTKVSYFLKKTDKKMDIIPFDEL